MGPAMASAHHLDATDDPKMRFTFDSTQCRHSVALVELRSKMMAQRGITLRAETNRFQRTGKIPVAASKTLSSMIEQKQWQSAEISHHPSHMTC